jgi:hypothetical protein
LPAYKYTGTDLRYYPGIGRDVSPGDSVMWNEEPEDGRWEAADAGTVSAPAPAPDPAVVAPAADTTSKGAA